MNKFVLIVVISLLACFGGFAAPFTTPNTGVMWTLDSIVTYSAGTLTGLFPNYSLTDLVTISASDRLTIQPGSVITINQGSGIGFTVFGAFIAEGTAVDSIVFHGAIASAGSYRGIRIEDSAVDSLTRFAYCRLQDGTDAIHCLHANPLIRFCVFTNNSNYAVRCFNASPTILSNVFIENRRSAVTVNLNSSPVIENNLFTNNNSENTSPRNQITVGPQGVNNPIIRGNEISNQSYFRAGAISLVNIESGGGCGALVENNYLHDNSFGILSQGVNMTPRIRYNRIEGNRINPDPMISGSGITIQVGGPSNAPIITGNVIRENYWGITCYSPGDPTNSPLPNIGNLMNADTSDDGWNILENNNNGGVIYQLFNNATTNIFGQNNFWGSDDSLLVESWITHQADSSIYGAVLYHPFGVRGLGQPRNFRARQESDSTVRLSWSFDAPSSTSSIHVLSGGDSLALSLVASLAGTDTALTLSAPFGALRFYGIASSNRFGVSDTTLASFRIMDITPPAQPQGLVIMGYSGFMVRTELTWSPNTEADLSRYDIFRSLFDSSMFALVGSVPVPETTFTDTIACDTTYIYTLVAVDTANNSSPGLAEWFGHPCPLSAEHESGMPTEYRLYQNFPNPFNPLTTIRFDIPHSSEAHLTIVDILGQEVETVFTGYLPPGSYRHFWNGKSVASGVYFYRLEVNGAQYMRKLILLR